VSCILLISGLVSSSHVTVAGTIRDMEKSGWRKIEDFREKPGCVVLWDPIVQDGKHHMHIGFYIGDDQAVSNRSSLRMPGEHSMYYSALDKDGQKRNATVYSCYWHPALDDGIIEA
jgi:hypothetical protein